MKNEKLIAQQIKKVSSEKFQIFLHDEDGLILMAGEYERDLALLSNGRLRHHIRDFLAEGFGTCPGATVQIAEVLK